MDFNKVEDDVKLVLKDNQMTRCDDHQLYASYVWMILERAGAKVGAGWMEKVLSDNRYRIIHGIATFETVSRVRRKLQANDLFTPSKEIKEKREEMIKEYKRYARESIKDN